MNITYYNANGSINFQSYPYKFVSYAGNGAEAVINTVPIVGKGSLETGLRLDDRLFSLSIIVEGAGESDVACKVRSLYSKCNPLYTGYLTFEFPNSSYRLYCRPEKVIPSRELGSGRRFYKTTISFRATDPLFYEETENTVNFGDYVAGFRFPFRFPLNFGKNGSKNYLTNDGEWETPFYIRLSGDLEYPVVYNRTTNQNIRVNTILSGTDYLEISTRLGDEYIKLNGVNAYQYFDDASEFFKLPIGENFIQYRSTGDTANFTAIMTYRRGFLGI